MDPKLKKAIYIAIGIAVIVFILLVLFLIVVPGTNQCGDFFEDIDEKVFTVEENLQGSTYEMYVVDGYGERKGVYFEGLEQVGFNFFFEKYNTTKTDANSVVGRIMFRDANSGDVYKFHRCGESLTRYRILEDINQAEHRLFSLELKKEKIANIIRTDSNCTKSMVQVVDLQGVFMANLTQNCDTTHDTWTVINLSDVDNYVIGFIAYIFSFSGF